MSAIDETGMCYFAALIEGLRLINEKEADLGIELATEEIDFSALVEFVSRKGDRLVHLMKSQTTKLIYWSPEEFHAVAAELARLGVKDFDLAQQVLPESRRRSNPPNYGIKSKLCKMAGVPLARRGAAPATRELAAPQSADRPPVPRPTNPAAALAPALSESITSALADQIVAALGEISINALLAAVDRLRAQPTA